jgi:hypothetical protein
MILRYFFHAIALPLFEFGFIGFDLVSIFFLIFPIDFLGKEEQIFW